MNSMRMIGRLGPEGVSLAGLVILSSLCGNPAYLVGYLAVCMIILPVKCSPVVLGRRVLSIPIAGVVLWTYFEFCPFYVFGFFLCCDFYLNEIILLMS